jgi:hypothetical protein
MDEEIAPPQGFVAWGPFVRDNYQAWRVTRADLIIAGIAFDLASFFAHSATCIAITQTIGCGRPWRSAYIWMIWLELAASVMLAIECLLYLLRVVRPSFYFFMSTYKSLRQVSVVYSSLRTVLCWVIRVQLLPQIIINRIPIILRDCARGRHLVIGTAVIITVVNISVLCIWIPARLQISYRYVFTRNSFVQLVYYLQMDPD